MKADNRRQEIIDLLISEQNPISGNELSKRLGVSRQIIVQDISALKAAGFMILSTHQGYIFHKIPLAKRVFKTYHTTDKTEDELNIIVDFGGTVADVFVWHKVYGKIEASLNISSRLQVKQFIEGVRSGKSTELMNVTGGYHYHTVTAESEDILDRIQNELKDKNYIAPEV